jgi:hypothetical protein
MTHTGLTMTNHPDHPDLTDLAEAIADAIDTIVRSAIQEMTET